MQFSENAGRKPIWNNKNTITIRVPKFIASQVLELAHRLDSGEKIESDTKSRIADSDCVIQSNSPINEIIIKLEVLNQEPKFDFVIESKAGTQSVTNLEITTSKSNFLHNETITKSKTEAIEVAKKILKHKKSARISLARLISKLYSQIVSPFDLN